MKLDLETLRRVKFTFDLHSDMSSRCNGYRSLCDMITEAENDNKVTPDLEKPDFGYSINQAIRLLGWDLDGSAESNDMIKLADYIKRIWISPLQKELLELKAEIGELLAVMHGDGGHYQSKHGTNKAVKDAFELIGNKWVTNEHLVDINEVIKERDALKAELSEANNRLMAAKTMMTHYYSKLNNEQQNIDPEIKKIVDDNFWDMV